MTVNSRRREDRLYIVALPAFLVALGLLGVPALLVGAIGLLVGALAIAVFRRRLEAWGPSGSRSGRRRQAVPPKYVPRVLESSSTRRRRLSPLRRQRQSTPPLRFR